MSKIEEISKHGSFHDHVEARYRAKELNTVNDSDNLEYIVKIEQGQFVVVLLAGLSDDTIY